MNSVVRKGISLAMCTLLIITALAGFLPVRQENVYADEEQEDVSYDDDTDVQALYDKMAGQDEEPKGYTDDFSKSADPYGYGVDVPFYLNKQSELALYATNNMKDDTSSKRTIKSYNLGSGSNVGNVLNGAEESTSYGIPMAGGKVQKPLNYVKMVAFDPTGSGRKDHLAVIGVWNEDYGSDDGSKSLWLYVYSKDGTKVSSYEKLGNMNWMGDHGNDNDGAWLYNAMNFLDITAGDYDNDKDHKDSLVVWGCLDDTGYGLQEIEVNVSRDSINLSKKGQNLDKTLLHDEYVTSGGTLATNHKWVDNKLCGALATGDVNGDNIDDLVALSFVDILTDSDSGRRQRTQMYRPYLAVSYGAKGTTNIVGKKNTEAGVWSQTGSSDGVAEWLTCMAADVSLGDINGDNVDEIVVAGLKNEVHGNVNTLVDSPYVDSRIQESKTTIAAYKCSGSTTEQLCLEMHEANEWTSDGYYPLVNGTDESYDQCLQQYAVECFAVNGKGNPYMVFINGDIYKFDSNKMTCVHECNYFKEHDRYFLETGIELTNTCFTSVASGNFDGNDHGYEQVVYTVGVKVSKHERYFLAAGITGGDFTQPTTEAGLAKSYYSTSMNTYETEANRKVWFPSKESPDNFISALLKNNAGLNYCACAIDNDEDGILVRYHDKGYVYTDPDILGVLQAAPKYEELGEYGANDNETSYSFSKSISYEDTTMDSVSFGAGVTHSLEGTMGGYEVKAGYAMDWSQEFTKGFSVSKEYTFTALKNDAVVMYRTPVTLYYYQVKLPSGEWSDENAPDEEDNGIVLSFPGTPAYSIVSVDKYNEFAEYYNNTNEAKMKSLGKSASDAPKLALLEDTDSKKLYLNTKGDPAKYMNRKGYPAGVTILQDEANAFEVSTGATGFNYGTETSTSESESMSHGFTFELTISFGLGIPCFVESSVGAYASLEYMHGNTHTTTDTKGKGVGCSISNAEEEDMRNAGYSKAACASYGYSYQMAKWDSPIKSSVPYEDPLTGQTTMTEQYVPIFGYVLSDVKKPIYAGINAPATLNLSSGYGATTSGTFSIAGDPVPAVTKVSGNSKITYNSITRKLEVAPGLSVGTYPVKLKADNGIPGKEYICDFKVIVKAPDYSENGIINNVKSLISGLPKPGDMLLSDEVYVQQARTAYDALTDAQKAKISTTLTDKLEAAEAQIAGFREAAKAFDEKVTSELPKIQNAITEMIGAMSGGSMPAFDDVQTIIDQFTVIEETYNNLDNDQKVLVAPESTAAIAQATSDIASMVNTYDEKTLKEAELKNKKKADKDAADAVKLLIDAISDLEAIDPKTTDETEFEQKYQTAVKEVELARKGYDSLTIQQKSLVENADKLVTAERTLGTLQAERCSEVVTQQEMTALNDAEAKIKKIPTTVKLKSDAAIKRARYTYDRLNPETKVTVDPALVTKLKAAEKKITTFKSTIKKNGTAIRKVTGRKKAVKVTWKKQAKKVGGSAITGYEVQVARNKKFTLGKKTVKVKGVKKISTIIKKLKGKKKYFARVRCYTKTTLTTYNSKWSKIKYAKTK